jgi:hypothetical protein
MRPGVERQKVMRPTLLARLLKATPLGRRPRRGSRLARRRRRGRRPARTARTVARWWSPGCDRLREAGQPEGGELSHAMLKPAHGDRAGEHPKAAALDERQLDPACDHRTGKVAVADEHYVARGHVFQRQCHGSIGAVADLSHTLATGATVRPDQPIRNRLVDLRGRQTFVGSVIPFSEQGRHLVNREPGQLGCGQGTDTRAADHNWISEFQFTENAPGKFGLHSAGVIQFEIGASGVLAVSPCRSNTSRWFSMLMLTDSA